MEYFSATKYAGQKVREEPYDASHVNPIRYTLIFIIAVFLLVSTLYLLNPPVTVAALQDISSYSGWLIVLFGVIFGSLLIKKGFKNRASRR